MISAIIQAILETLTGFGTGGATFLNSFVQELVFVQGADGATELSAFASWSLAFLGLGLVLGLGGLVIGAVTRKSH